MAIERIQVTRPAFPATRRVTAAGIVRGDFVIVGGLKGFAVEDSRTEGELTGTVLIAFGEVNDVNLVADAAGAINEGDYLKWDTSLVGGDGAMTDTGASAADHDAIAGLGIALGAGESGVGEVLVPAPY